MTKTDLAWVAGLLEGEGCISLSRSGARSLVLNLVVNTTDRDHVERLSALFGGAIQTRSKPTAGGRQLQEWRLTSKRACAVLTAVRPYIVGVRWRRRIATALAFQEAKLPAGGGNTARSDDYYARLEKLAAAVRAATYA